MLKKAEELRKMKTKGGTGSSAWSPGFGGGGGGSNNSVGRLDTPVIDTTHNEPVKPYTTIRYLNFQVFFLNQPNLPTYKAR